MTIDYGNLVLQTYLGKINLLILINVVNNLVVLKDFSLHTGLPQILTFSYMYMCMVVSTSVDVCLYVCTGNSPPGR